MAVYTDYVIRAISDTKLVSPSPWQQYSRETARHVQHRQAQAAPLNPCV